MQHELSGEPVGEDEFSHLLKTCTVLPARAAVAVSGGPDSMALAYLCQRWAQIHSQEPPVAIIVDHALREGSADETFLTKQRLQMMGLQAIIKRWEHPPITSRIHDEARRARYDLLLAACREHACDGLLLAHHCDDQAETVLMRLAKGSGIEGLAGMSTTSTKEGIALLRPLLPIAKSRLMATCHQAGIDFITDTSNQSEKFARGRLRRVMPLLANEGLSTKRLLAIADHAQEAAEALRHMTQDFLIQHSHRDLAGSIFIERRALRAAPRAIARRAITTALQHICPQDYNPEHVAVSHVLDAMACDGFNARTLHGCLIGGGSKHITFTREVALITDNGILTSHEPLIWDKRWRIAVPVGTALNCIVAPLGTLDHAVLDNLVPGLRQQVPQGRGRAALPALWDHTKHLIGVFKPGVDAHLLNSWPV